MGSTFLNSSRAVLRPSLRSHFLRAAPDDGLPFLRLALLTLGALLIHGYHLGVEDGEIYLPAIRKLLHPNLYPYASQFFLSHERLSLFAPFVALSARITHLSVDWTVFLWYLVLVYAMLAACWMLLALCFQSPRARWCGVLLITAVITMPAANTGLLLIDPYLTARSFSTPLTLFALAAFLARRYPVAVTLTLLTASVHPQMAVYLVFLAAVLAVCERAERKAPRLELVTVPAVLVALPLSFHLGPATQPYREALYSRDFFFLSNWTWYHWLGLLGPLAFLAWFWRGKLRGTTPEFSRLSLALLPFGIISILAAAILTSSPQFDMYERLQPLRSFHLITLVFVPFLGGVIGEYWARRRAWVIPALVIPLAVLMFWVERTTYPDSPHIEWPGQTTSPNDWVNVLLWIRHNTPENAVFAVDSRYFLDRGVDVHGFRAVAARAALADYYKDGGAVSVFPDLAPAWKQMTDATYGLNHFSRRDFIRLAREYPVNWTLIHGLAPPGMDCPYQQRGYSVCRIPPAPGELALAE
jgi:hypothetical protein